MHLVSQFQDITTIVNREAAEFVMKGNQWNLNSAINWFNEHRHNDDLPSDLRRALKTKEELKEEEEGKRYKILNISFSNYQFIYICLYS